MRERAPEQTIPKGPEPLRYATGERKMFQKLCLFKERDFTTLLSIAYPHRTIYNNLVRFSQLHLGLRV